MANETQPRYLCAILRADWGKEIGKRAMYVADVSVREVRRVDAGALSVGAVLKEAERRATNGPALATFDAPLGIPEKLPSGSSRTPFLGVAEDLP